MDIWDLYRAFARPRPDQIVEALALTRDIHAHNGWGETPFILFQSHRSHRDDEGNARVLEAFLKRGIDPNETRPYQLPLLHCFETNPACLAVLTKYGADNWDPDHTVWRVPSTRLHTFGLRNPASPIPRIVIASLKFCEDLGYLIADLLAA